MQRLLALAFVVFCIWPITEKMQNAASGDRHENFNRRILASQSAAELTMTTSSIIIPALTDTSSTVASKGEEKKSTEKLETTATTETSEMATQTKTPAGTADNFNPAMPTGSTGMFGGFTDSFQSVFQQVYFFQMLLQQVQLTMGMLMNPAAWTQYQPQQMLYNFSSPGINNLPRFSPGNQQMLLGAPGMMGASPFSGMQTLSY